MRVYLDNCCFNRPFDDQGQIRIRLEAEAKLDTQERIRRGEIELAWSYILDYENAANPFEDRKQAIAAWRDYASVDIAETPGLLRLAESLAAAGVKAKDALHIACAIEAKCDCFLTTDDSLLRKGRDISEVKVLDPTAFVREVIP